MAKKYNYDANCQNCGSYTRKGQCRKAMNTNIDYSIDDNPHCWDWTRSFKSIISQQISKLSKCKIFSN